MIRQSLESLLTRTLFSQFFLTTPLLASVPALANNVCANAQDCYRRGAVLYEQRKYTAALTFFQESYQRTTNHGVKSILLYNIASTYANLRQPKLAIEYLNLYLAENQSELKEVGQLRETFIMYSEGLELYEQKAYAAAAQKFKTVYNLATKGLRVIVARDLADSYEQLLNLNDKNKAKWGIK